MNLLLFSRKSIRLEANFFSSFHFFVIEKTVNIFQTCICRFYKHAGHYLQDKLLSSTRVTRELQPLVAALRPLFTFHSFVRRPKRPIVFCSFCLRMEKKTIRRFGRRTKRSKWKAAVIHHCTMLNFE